jgi:uncharacterized OsmC-like protein
MSSLREYLIQKRAAVRAKKSAVSDGTATVHHQRAEVTVEGRSGVRRIRIRDFQVVLDSGPDFAGYHLGPSSQELFLGTVGSCLAHTFLIHAADLEIPLDGVRVEVTAVQDPRAGSPGFEQVPFYPHDIAYVAHISSPAPLADVERLRAVVEAACPIFNLVQDPQRVSGRLVHTGPTN